ncbi:MAG: hypothetical protein WC647_06505 [Desulfomonilaceae bacterium]|jgi:hypothetical protein
MDYNLLIKAGFMGFAASTGAICIVFLVTGNLLKITRRKFSSVYLLAGVVSFITVYLLLYFKIRPSEMENPQFFLTGVIGGWLASILFGVTQFKNFLRSFLQP